MALFDTKLKSGVSSPFGSPGGAVLSNIVKKNAILKIATWNVRSLYDMIKTECAINEMKRMKIEVLGVSEMRWKGSGVHSMGQYKVYYSGNDEPGHWRGVGFIITNRVDAAVKNFVPHSDRVAMLQINGSVNINIIQVYAPTADKDDEEIEAFYEDVKKVLMLTKREEVNILMGDFNAKVGDGVCAGVTGRYGLGERNERGGRLIQFCQEEEFVITNTFFQLPPRRLYTWRSPRDQEEHIVRNQIDYVTINSRFRNAVKSTKTYPGADVGSDHTPVVSKIEVRFKKIPKKPKKAIIDIRKLSEEGIRDEVSKELEEQFDTNAVMQSDDVENMWSVIRTILNTTSENHLKAEKGRHKEWMTTEILALMEERRRWLSVSKQKYREIHIIIQKKIREAKERREEEKCRELEMLQERHDTFNLHKRIRELVTRKRGKPVAAFEDDDGNPVMDLPGKKMLWEKYIESLFDDERDDEPALESADSGPEILCDEVRYAIKQLNNGKAPGPDNIHGEIIKLIDDNGVELLTKLFNKVYATGTFPNDWLKSHFVTLPKKPNARRCQDHRTISLMSHVIKVYLKVILKRIYRQCDEMMSKEQFGFRNGFGTRDALFGLQVLVQRSLDMNVDVYVCFIDFEKAFDKVRHQLLLETLKRVGIDERNVNTIGSLYWHQVASVLVEYEETREIAIKRGVRQGCVLSPTLFNLYAENIMAEALDDATEGILINGQLINNLRYADDTVLIASTPEDLQRLLDRVNAASGNYGIKINVKKTKAMVISKRENLPGSFTLNGEPIERCSTFKYLGCLVNERWEMGQEIRSRIEQARDVFTKMRKVLTSRNINLSLRLRMVRCYVFPIVLYGMEGWTLTQSLENKITAFEMWVYRRMLKISWQHHVPNAEVLQRMNTENELLLTVKKRKLLYFGHVMRNDKYHILHLIIQGKIEGRRATGRRRTSWLKNLRQWFGRSTRSLFRAAASKVQIAMMIANLR